MKTNQVHRGEIVEKVIRSQGVNITKLAEQIGVTKPTIYNQLEIPDMKVSYILKIGEVLGVDFTKYIPNLLEDIPDLTPSDKASEIMYQSPPAPLDMMVRLDGTKSTLETVITRLTKLNDVISH